MSEKNYTTKEKNNEYSRKNYRTKKGKIANIYHQQKASSKVRGHDAPMYSQAELQEWVLSKYIFHYLHKRWVKSGYKKELVTGLMIA